MGRQALQFQNNNYYYDWCCNDTAIIWDSKNLGASTFGDNTKAGFRCQPTGEDKDGKCGGVASWYSPI